jgi:hypothetical protein
VPADRFRSGGHDAHHHRLVWESCPRYHGQCQTREAWGFWVSGLRVAGCGFPTPHPRPTPPHHRVGVGTDPYGRPGDPRPAWAARPDDGGRAWEPAPTRRHPPPPFSMPHSLTGVGVMSGRWRGDAGVRPYTRRHPTPPFSTPHSLTGVGVMSGRWRADAGVRPYARRHPTPPFVREMSMVSPYFRGPPTT